MNAQVDADVMIDAQPALRAPRVVEVVGPAGAGKTTLARALAEASPNVRLGNFPDVRSLRAAPFFCWHGLRMAPRFLQPPSSNSRRLTAREFAWMCILDGWPGVLQNEWEAKRKVSVLDQGPVYLMTELREWGPEHLRNRPPDGTWQELHARWAGMLDAIVWLDAPDAVLAERIRGREKAHIVKGKSSDAIFDFLHRFRSAYARTLSLLTMPDAGFRFLHFDTGRQTTDEIACELLDAFGLKPCAPFSSAPP